MYTVSPMSPEEIKDLSVFQLSNEGLANCGRPDTHDSSGARFLANVRDNALEAVEEAITSEPSQWGAEADWSERVTALVDELVPVYTHDRWQAFIDLEAYQEDVDLGGYTEFNDAAAAALEEIGVRLATSIYDSIERWREQEAEENELESASPESS